MAPSVSAAALALSANSFVSLAACFASSENSSALFLCSSAALAKSSASSAKLSALSANVSALSVNWVLVGFGVVSSDPESGTCLLSVFLIRRRAFLPGIFPYRETGVSKPDFSHIFDREKLRRRNSGRYLASWLFRFVDS